MSLTEISFAQFANLLHSKFRVHGGAAQPVEVELVEATPYETSRDTAPAQTGNFSLTFAGPQHPFLPQRTYLFEHETLGSGDLFIVPIGQDKRGYRYEAVFNRPVQQAALDKTV
ncbi:MAG: hypothetical protein H7X97_00550 [Opitutaceae bacterium]|nr:hypothetical protein [Verrucomicrobiales bacterium]